METSKRSSNLELLKIIAMFLICISHCYNFSGYANTLSSNVADVFTVMIKNVGWLGDVIFITCSVYFLVDSKPKINLRKIVLYYLDLAILFYCYLGVFALCKVDIPHDVLIGTLTTTVVHDYWFAINYIIYLAVLPLLLFVINHISKKVHFSLMIVTTLVALTELVLEWYGLFTFGNWITFYTIFFIVSYGKRYGRFIFLKDLGNRKNLIILAGLVVFWFLETMLCPLFFKYIGLANCEHTDINYIYSPLMYLISFEMFFIFKNLKIGYSKIINYISSLSLIFYIAHHNKYTCLVVDPFCNSVINNRLQAYRPLLVLGFGTIIFIGGIIISVIYKETIHRLLVLITNKIPDIEFNKKSSKKSE